MKYQKIAQCPIELEELFQLVNLLPKDVDLLRKTLTVLHLEFNQRFNANPEKFRKINNSLEEKIKKLHPELANDIFISISDEGFINQKFQIERLINEKKTLRAVIQNYKEFIGFNNPQATFMLDKALTTIGFNQDSTIQFASFRILDILSRNKIPIKRLGICPICDEVFWAKRENAPTCIKRQCSNNFHQRKRRINEYQQRLDKKVRNLKKQRNSLSAEHIVITSLEIEIQILERKIKQEKNKNGNL